MILFLAVEQEPLRSFVLGPSDQCVPLAFKLETRHGVAAGSTDACQTDIDDRARAEEFRKERLQLAKLRGCIYQDGSRPMKPNDFGWSCKCAEHENDATILSQMRHGFDATAGEVEV